MADKDFTPRELEIMAKAWTCMTEEPKVDYEKLAAACGMTNPRSASNAWAAIKKKILAKANTTKGDGEDSTPKPTPKSTPGSKRKKKADTDADADDEQTSVKKSKAKGKGVKTKSEAKVDEKIDDGEAESAPVKSEEVDDLI